MRLLIILVLSFFFNTIYAQKYPNIEFDESLKTSEFYVDNFENRAENGAGIWILKENRKLKFKVKNGSPHNPPAQFIGYWSLYKDTIIFNIKKRTLYDYKINPSKQRPNTLKFKIFTFKWLTETSSLTENKNQISIITFCTVLLGNQIEMNKLKNELDSVLQVNSYLYQPTEDSDLIMQMERIQSILNVLNKFFYDKKLFYSVRIYLNGNLSEYY
jgi:hypothetical protein